MRIVIASGKGGTGKTTLAVNLATALAGGVPVGLLDCDVEEPNCHLYLRPPFDAARPVGTPIPVVDTEVCTGCGLCARACEFNALLALPAAPLLLPELCHGCGTCAYVCPEEAISETDREMRADRRGRGGRYLLPLGTSNAGEARSTPVIAAVKDLQHCASARDHHHRCASGGSLPGGRDAAGSGLHSVGDRADPVRTSRPETRRRDRPASWISPSEWSSTGRAWATPA